MIEKRQPLRNALLSSLTREELGAICPELMRADLVSGERLGRPGAPVDGVWFPETGFVSVMRHGASNAKTEVAMVGREGAVGAFAPDAEWSPPYEFVVQQRGVAHFLPTNRLSDIFERSPAVRDVLQTALFMLLDQAALTAHANARGRVIERVAHWLLRSHDRIDADVVFVTHDTLSSLLGVRRVGVTNALHILEGEQLVRAYRGRVWVLDRPGLIAVANGLYPDTVARRGEVRRSAVPAQRAFP